jgi:hypothetical protein
MILVFISLCSLTYISVEVTRCTAFLGAHTAHQQIPPLLEPEGSSLCTQKPAILAFSHASERQFVPVPFRPRKRHRNCWLENLKSRNHFGRTRYRWDDNIEIHKYYGNRYQCKECTIDDWSSCHTSIMTTAVASTAQFITITGKSNRRWQHDVAGQRHGKTTCWNSALRHPPFPSTRVFPPPRLPTSLFNDAKFC